MTIEGAFVLLTLLLMMIALLLEFSRPEFILFITVSLFLITGIISVDEALAGFSNEGMLTVALLFIVAAAIQKSGIADRMIKKLLGVKHSERSALAKILLPVIGVSSLLNNTPIVVTLTPIIRKWCTDNQIAPSKFLLPLSYATILGGTLTLIGTSTNLVIYGFMIDEGLKGFSFFQLGYVTFPAVVLGFIYLITIGYRLLPNHKVLYEEVREHNKEYLSQVIVESGFPYINHTIEEAGLQNLKGLFLIEIIRENEKITPVRSTTKIKAGDALLLLCGPDFKNKMKQSNDFYVTTPLNTPVLFEDKRKGWLSFLILLIAILLVTCNILSMIKAMVIAVILLLLFNVMNFEEAMKSIHFNVLFLIACAFGIGTALYQSGSASILANGLVAFAKPYGVIAVIGLIYLATNLLTEFLSNNATAVMMFPIATETALQVGADPIPFILAITVAASASFSTPIGYQTNLIVFGPGGYRTKDYLKVGVPLNIIVMISTLLMIYLFWI